ncbi:MAG TPA: hypothetical protein VFB58_02185 [Chloroflexota bacterium]|nr:hypothetical protein [Chloroflexota bacterium]
MAVAEVPESEAEGKVKEIYGDIKDTLRLPFVPPVFRHVAATPDYLIVARRALKPNAQTLYFEREADRIRSEAARIMTQLGRPPAPDETARPALRVLHYAAPKVFLSSAALRLATAGELPRMQVLPLTQKQQIKPGVPPEAASVQLPAEDAAPHLLSVVMDHHGRLPPSEEIVPASPSYLTAAWGAVEDATLRAEYAQLLRTLHRLADVAVTALPYRMDIAPHVLRLCGLSESQIDEIRATLHQDTHEAAQMVANVAYLAGAMEGAAAAESPFPAEVL